MTTKAYVLIETMVGRNRDIITILKKVKNISDVEMVTGPFDLIAVIEAESLADIGDIVTTRIHPISGITRTVTCLVM